MFDNVTRCAQNLNAWYRTEAIKTVAFLIFIKGKIQMLLFITGAF
jgi:hypothetical protein